MPLTQEQLSLRQTGMGGSEIASLVNDLSPWGSVFDLWRSKIGEVVQRPMTDQMKIGTHLEPGVVSLYADVNKRRVTFPGTLRHPKHSVVLATPDGISYDAENEDEPPVILEVKCPHYRNAPMWKALGPDEIPPYYWPQLTWEMAVSNIKTAHLVAFFGELPAVHTVHFIPDMFEGLVELAEQFWRDYVVTRKEPPIDATKSAAEYINSKYPAPKVTTFTVATEADMVWVRQLHRARAMITEGQKLELEARNHITDAIGDNAGMEGPGFSIPWRKNKDSSVVDHKALVAELMLTDPTVIQRHTIIKPAGARVFAPRFDKEFGQ